MENQHLINLFQDTELFLLDDSEKTNEHNNTIEIVEEPKQISAVENKPAFDLDKVYIFSDYIISASEKEFLIKVLSAVKINLEEDCIITKWNEDAKAFSGRNFVFSENINTCGVTSKRISAPALKTISENIEFKKELWETMQKLFV